MAVHAACSLELYLPARVSGGMSRKEMVRGAPHLRAQRLWRRAGSRLEPTVGPRQRSSVGGSVRSRSTTGRLSQHTQLPWCLRPRGTRQVVPALSTGERFWSPALSRIWGHIQSSWREHQRCPCESWRGQVCGLASRAPCLPFLTDPESCSSFRPPGTGLWAPSGALSATG